MSIYCDPRRIPLPPIFDYDDFVCPVIGGGGVQGQQGIEGFQGLRGLQGPQGFQGRQGIQGFVGIQGAGAGNGFQGTQGATGKIASYQLGQPANLAGQTGVEWLGLTGNNFILTISNVIRPNTADLFGWQVGDATGYITTGYTGMYQQATVFGSSGTRIALTTSYLQTTSVSQGHTITSFLRSYKDNEYFLTMTGAIAYGLAPTEISGGGAIVTSSPIDKIRFINLTAGQTFTSGYANVLSYSN